MGCALGKVSAFQHVMHAGRHGVYFPMVARVHMCSRRGASLGSLIVGNLKSDSAFEGLAGMGVGS